MMKVWIILLYYLRYYSTNLDSALAQSLTVD